MQNHWLFSSDNICFFKCQKADAKKKSRKDEKTLEELNSAHCRLQAKCQLLQTVTLNELSFSCFCHIINILLTELSLSVWENLDLGRVYRPHCVRSVLTTSIKILPYRPPARLIRAKYQKMIRNGHKCRIPISWTTKGNKKWLNNVSLRHSTWHLKSHFTVGSADC